LNQAKVPDYTLLHLLILADSSPVFKLVGNALKKVEGLLD